MELIIYRTGDLLAACLAWFLFYLYRQGVEGKNAAFPEVLFEARLWQGLIIIPVFWLILYTVFDKHRDIYRFSRLDTLRSTLFTVFFGSLLIFFTVLKDDQALQFTSYFSLFAILFLLQFVITSLVRMTILTIASRRLKTGKVSYNTLIIGGDKNAVDLYEEVMARPYSLGHNFVGFIDSNGKSKNHLESFLPKLGKLKDLHTVMERSEIEEVIIAVETSEHNKLKSILDDLFDFSDRVLIKVIPDTYDIMLGTVKMNHIYGAVLIEIDQELMPNWQKVIKRFMDYIISIIALLILSPVILLSVIKVKLGSKGPVFYKQER